MNPMCKSVLTVYSRPSETLSLTSNFNYTFSDSEGDKNVAKLIFSRCSFRLSRCSRSPLRFRVQKGGTCWPLSPVHSLQVQHMGVRAIGLRWRFRAILRKIVFFFRLQEQSDKFT